MNRLLINTTARNTTCFLLLFLGLFAVDSFAVDKVFAAARAKAAKGEPQAQFELGRMYEFGIRTSPNSAKAARWYRKAAEQGLPQAEYSLARMLLAGEGIAGDQRQAILWLRRAASHNYALAMNRLGVIYERGLGVPADAVEAYIWYSLAGEAQNIAGTVNRDQLSGRMAGAQIAEARRRVATHRSNIADIAALQPGRVAKP